jgi:hypothetical protein
MPPSFWSLSGGIVVPTRPFGQREEHGRYLCERCGDAMTDWFISAAQSPTGADMACCRACTPDGVLLVRGEQDGSASA